MKYRMGTQRRSSPSSLQPDEQFLVGWRHTVPRSLHLAYVAIAVAGEYSFQEARRYSDTQLSACDLKKGPALGRVHDIKHLRSVVAQLVRIERAHRDDELGQRGKLLCLFLS